MLTSASQYMAMQTYSYVMWIYFLTLVVLTNFCILNLTMAVIALAYSDVREESRQSKRKAAEAAAFTRTLAERSRARTSAQILPKTPSRDRVARPVASSAPTQPHEARNPKAAASTGPTPYARYGDCM